MEKVKLLKNSYGRRIFPYMFNFNMTSEDIAVYLNINREEFLSNFDLCEEHSCTISSIDKYEIYISGDEDGITLEIEYLPLINFIS